MAALVSTASADNFDRWMDRVHKIAPHYRLKLHPKDELLNATEREWFHLYYWQAGYSPKRAILATLESDFLNHEINAKPLHSWLIHYKIYVRGDVTKIGYGRVIASNRDGAIARLKWETSGEGKLRILSIEKENSK